MVLRQLAKDESKGAELIVESIDRAKQAVQCDLNDGTSWSMANYIQMFFY